MTSITREKTRARLDLEEAAEHMRLARAALGREGAGAAVARESIATAVKFLSSAGGHLGAVDGDPEPAEPGQDVYTAEEG